MKYRFLGEPDKRFPNLETGKVYNLKVVTHFWSDKPRIIIPFYCPYKNWLTFYQNWRPITVKMMRLERGLDKEKKSSYD